MFLFFGKSASRPLASRYSLFDKFTTDRAAGAVNGTSAEPTGGVRTVTDTNNKISVSGGVLNFATGEAVNDGVWWTSLPRLLGRTFLLAVNIADVNTGCYLGFDVNQAGAVSIANLISGGVLSARTGAATNVVTGTISYNTNYQIGLVARSIGAFYFIRGGAFTNWTLHFVDANGTTALVPAITTTGTTSTFTADNIRVPKRLFIPVPLQSDGFSAATTDGQGNAENNGPVGNAWTGSTWSVGSGVASNTPTLGAELLTNGDFESGDVGWTKGTGWTIVGGKGIATAAPVGQLLSQSVMTSGLWYKASFVIDSLSAGQLAVYNGSGVAGAGQTSGTVTRYFRALGAVFGIRPSSSSTTAQIDNATLVPLTLSSLFRSLSSSSPNVIADVNVTVTQGTQAGLVLNLDSASSPANFVIAYHDGTNAILEKCVAGVYTTLISAAATYSAGATLRVIKDGTQYRLFYNNAAVGTAQTISDTSIVNNTLHGLFSTYDSNTFDNFVIWARGNEGQYNGLDSL